MKENPVLNQKGFSLVEALVAVVVLSIGLLAVGLMQVSAIKGNTNALERSDGVEVAQSVLNVLRALPADDGRLTGSTNLAKLNDGLANPPDPAAAGHQGDAIFANYPNIGAGGRAYTVFWNVVDDAASPNTSRKTVRIFVYWNDSRFGLNKAVMTTVLGGFYL